MDKKDKIYIAGHTGMVGSAISRKLEAAGYTHQVFRTQQELDLTNQQAVLDFFEKERPDYVFLAAARVGGIMANNTFRAQFLYDNLMIAGNIIHAAYIHKVKKLLFLGSSCIYPRDAIQPLREESLLTGPLEPTNEPYAIAKIAGIKLCESYFRQYGSNYISVMPTNLYGPNDNYNLASSHVLPALVRKFYLAARLEQGDLDALRFDLGRDGETCTTEPEVLQKLLQYGITPHPSQVTLWGSGTPLREFLHVDDVADACLFLMQQVDAASLYSGGISHLNVGSGTDVSIHDLAVMIQKETGFRGSIVWDSSKPDGTPRKLMDVSRLQALGWTARISLEEGIRDVVESYKSVDGQWAVIGTLSQFKGKSRDGVSG